MEVFYGISKSREHTQGLRRRAETPGEKQENLLLRVDLRLNNLCGSRDLRAAFFCAI